MRDYKKEMITKFDTFRYKYDMHNVFSDFLEISAITLSNQYDGHDYVEREKQYIATVKKYKREEVAVFAEIMALLYLAQMTSPRDYLGDIYMEMKLTDKWKGQFFTPYSVAMVMARMTIDEDIMKKAIKDNGYATICDPCCGGGVMPICAAVTLKDMGVDLAKEILITAQDIDIRGVYMTYIQLSLLGVSAQVIHGNTLLVECRSFWNTPATKVSNALIMQKAKTV